MALSKRRDGQNQSQRSGGSVDWRGRYEIENAPSVDAYVEEHPTVAAILLEAPEQIRVVFGEGGSPKLALQQDPEDGDCWLSISIPFDTEDESVLSRLYDLEDRWWLDRMQSTDAVVSFDVRAR